jgi:hypothetical protein
VQEFREIAPGVRIRALAVIDAANARAARQPLGIILDDSFGGETDVSSSSSNRVELSQENPLAPKLALAVLVVVGLSQLALWMFMVVAR